MSRFVVGITGGIGSGKSAVAALFAARGIVEVDTDRIAHRLTAPGGAAIPDLVAAFGAGVLDPLGALDRSAMRQRVFADPGERRRLEAILHPAIRREADLECRAAESPYAVLVVPLMAETWASGDYRQRCQRILVVDCNEATQVRRVMARNAMSEAEVRSVLAAQASRAGRLAIADDVISNDGRREDLEPQVARLHADYLHRAADT
jgi:dephospho-CoA kinase